MQSGSYDRKKGNRIADQVNTLRIFLFLLTPIGKIKNPEISSGAAICFGSKYLDPEVSKCFISFCHPMGIFFFLK